MPVARGQVSHDLGDLVHVATLQLLLVVLEPAAVLDIVGFMFWDFGGQAILDERSFLNNRIGTQLFGQNVNIWDDVANPLQSGAPFDGEGVRRQPVLLVENGIVRRVGSEEEDAVVAAVLEALAHRAGPVTVSPVMKDDA